MNSISTFLFKERTCDGYTVIGAGICPFSSGNFIVNSLKENLRLFKFDIINDPFYIDYMLASYVGNIVCQNTYGLGLSICIPGVSGPSGGIIGNPRSSITSAGGISENIGNGLSVAAYPGGPGLIIKGPAEEAEKILKCVNPGDGGLENLLKISGKCVKNSINVAIMVTDGTGGSEPGCVLSLENGVVKYLTIGRV